MKDKVRSIQLSILDVVVDICDKHNLTYWLDGGTLLGAVRHKGFIPWDDDIDIGLMREDYEQLLHVLESELPKNLALQTGETDSNFYFTFAKVRDINSKNNYPFEAYYRYKGIFIDIFPFDFVPQQRWIQKIQYRMLQVVEVMSIHNRTIQSLQKYNQANIFTRYSLVILARVGRCFRNRFYFNLNKLIRGLACFSKGDLIGDGYTSSFHYFKSIRKREIYLPTKKLEFEGKKYKVPQNCSQYLRTLYGDDYMTPINRNHQHLVNVEICSDENIE